MDICSSINIYDSLFKMVTITPQKFCNTQWPWSQNDCSFPILVSSISSLFRKQASNLTLWFQAFNLNVLYLQQGRGVYCKCNM